MPSDRYRPAMAKNGRSGTVRRLLVCLGVAAVAPLGSINTGSVVAAAVVAVVLAVIAWMVWGMLDDDDP